MSRPLKEQGEGGVRRLDRLVIHLGLVAAAQGSWLVLRSDTNVSPPQDVAVGDRLPSIIGKNRNGANQHISFAGREYTVVVGFAESCVYCDEAAPAWGSILDSIVGGAPVWFVTTDDSLAVEEFLTRHKLGSRSVLRFEGSVQERFRHPIGRITSRTPRIVVLDESGIVLSLTHGADLESLDWLPRP